MAATVTRTALRRVRLGGRHTYRAAVRHRVTLAVAAAVAVVTVGAAVGAGHDARPAFPGPDWSHSQMRPDARRPGRPPGTARRPLIEGPVGSLCDSPENPHVRKI